jgi:hypothetical protein
MKDELDVSQVVSAIERLQRNYRKPLPGAKLSRIPMTESHTPGGEARNGLDSDSDGTAAGAAGNPVTMENDLS